MKLTRAEIANIATNYSENDELIVLAKSWLLDCFEDEYDQEVIQELDVFGTIAAIERYYDGGWYEFINCTIH